jgi:hypothetical protein
MNTHKNTPQRHLGRYLCYFERGSSWSRSALLFCCALLLGATWSCSKKKKADAEKDKKQISTPAVGSAAFCKKHPQHAACTNEKKLESGTKKRMADPNAKQSGRTARLPNGVYDPRGKGMLGALEKLGPKTTKSLSDNPYGSLDDLGMLDGNTDGDAYNLGGLGLTGKGSKTGLPSLSKGGRLKGNGPVVIKKVTVQGKLPTIIIKRVTRHHLGELKYCYQSRGLAIEPNLTGTLTVGYIVTQKGTVSSAKIVSGTLKHGKTRSCILRALRRWRFPRPKSKSATVKQTFAFKPIPNKPRSSSESAGDATAGRMKLGYLSVSGALSKTQILSVLKTNRAALARCHKSSKNGRVDLSFVIASNGSIIVAPKVTSTTLNDPKIESRLKNTVRKLRFAKPRTGVVIVKLPLFFKSAS